MWSIPRLYNAIPYDPFKDFVAICEPVITPHVFAVKADLPANDMKEFVAMVKKDPDKFNVSTPPIGTTPQLQAEVLKLREGLQKMATVVFKGGGDAVKAVLAGTVQLNSGTLAPALPHIKAGTLKALAQTGATRFVGLPDVPTMTEQGYKDFVFDTYCALMAPAKVPPEIVATLEKTMSRHHRQARHARRSWSKRASTSPPRTARVTPRGSPKKSRCSRRSSRTPASPSCSARPRPRCNRSQVSGGRQMPFLRSMLLGLMAAAVTLTAAVAADDYPNKPVRIIIPFAPGGINDVAARVVATHLSERLGKQFIAENRSRRGRRRRHRNGRQRARPTATR